MAPPSKYTPAQQQFIELWMAEFLIKKASKNLGSFWQRMKKAWLREWPVELELGLPLQEVDENAECPPPLTTDEQAALDNALKAKFAQLRNSFFNGAAKIRAQRGGVGKSTLCLATLLFKARPKGRRRHQVLEVYQKVHHEKVKAVLRESEYDSLNEAALCRDDEGEWIDDEDDEVRMKRVSRTRSKQMKQVWDKEMEKVKEEIREMAKKEELPASTVEEEGKPFERTPEEYQTSIDESMQVAEMFLSEFHKMTGWMGALVYGGPIPRAGGELGVKTVSFGTTPGGLNFEQSHPDWKKKVTTPLFKFLRQAIPREVRLKRAIFTGEDSDAEDAADIQASPDDSPAPAKKSVKKKSVKQADTPVEEGAVSSSKPARRPKTKKTPNVPTTLPPTAAAAAPQNGVGATTSQVAPAPQVGAGIFEAEPGLSQDTAMGQGEVEMGAAAEGLDTMEDDGSLAFFASSSHFFPSDITPSQAYSPSSNFSLSPPSHNTSPARGSFPATLTSSFAPDMDFNMDDDLISAVDRSDDTFRSSTWSNWGPTENAGGGSFRFPAAFGFDTLSAPDKQLIEMHDNRLHLSVTADPPLFPMPDDPLGLQAFADRPSLFDAHPSAPRPTPAPHMTPLQRSTPIPRATRRADPAAGAPGAVPEMSFGRTPQYRPINDSRGSTGATSAKSTTSRPATPLPVTPPLCKTVAAPPSPPVYPQSRPMANQPKKAKQALMAEGMAKKMEAARAAKKGAEVKKVAQAKATAARGGKAKTKGTGAGGDSAGGVMEKEALGGVGDAPSAPPVPAKKDRKVEAEAEGVARVDAGDDIARPRHAIQAPRNRGAVLSLVERNKALESKSKASDDALLVKPKAGSKRTAPDPRENRPPQKRARAQ
ncbi:hypothetical protein FB451DRAFT_1196250 [Mycena latifolia]|nr:hypothetical protein FB451DRAFT_1196250 [Mycena latifolia]